MAIKITEECINCGACEPECPNNAIYETRKLNGYFVENFRASWTIRHVVFSEWHIIGQVNNVFNKLYEPNGYTYSYINNNVLTNENGYYPMAGTNYMLGVNIRL